MSRLRGKRRLGVRPPPKEGRIPTQLAPRLQRNPCYSKIMGRGSPSRKQRAPIDTTPRRHEEKRKEDEESPMTSERKNALYERDRRLNEPPASYTFRDPMTSKPEEKKDNVQQASANNNSNGSQA